jgi:hypothetical protein
VFRTGRDTSYGNEYFVLEGILRMEMTASHWKEFFEWTDLK